MSATVTFWWFPDEETAFLEFLESTGRVVALPFQSLQNKSDFVPRPIADFVKDSHPQQLFFGLEEQVSQADIATIETVENSNKVTRFRVFDMRSCVIGYDRGRPIDDDKLSPFNLYYYSNYTAESGTLLQRKPSDFVKWAKKVLQWVYKATPEWHQYRRYRVSKRVKAALEAGTLEIATY